MNYLNNEQLLCEMEKARQRAHQGARNPDGVSDNTSWARHARDYSNYYMEAKRRGLITDAAQERPSASACA
jgi:hypothetical protein